MPVQTLELTYDTTAKCLVIQIVTPFEQIPASQPISPRVYCQILLLTCSWEGECLIRIVLLKATEALAARRT